MLRWFVGGVAVLITCLLLPAAGSAQDKAQPKAKARATGHAYFLTGFMGVTSRLDNVMEKVKQRGVTATMASPGGYESLAKSAIGAHRRGARIVIVGYSLGGGGALNMAALLNAEKVPVELVLVVDGSAGPLSPNVRRVVNLYVPGGYGAPITRPANFRGSIQNVAAKGANVGHFSVIDAHEYQLVAYVISAAR
jgi:pimeloyl-ACP methyl ester carboxylesterase